MYLPLESLFRLAQLPLSLLGSDQPTPHSVEHDAKSSHHHGRKAIYNLGNLSPYHDAPIFPGVSQDLPDDCAVDQVILLHRHGSRGPEGEEQFVLELVDTLDKARDIIQAADLPSNLEFLKDGYEYNLVPAALTAVGREELFDHGVDFTIRYPGFTTDVVVSTTVQRVIDSAHFFGDGFFGPEEDEVTFLTTDDFTDSVPWLSSWYSCPNIFPTFVAAYEAAGEWAAKTYPPIVERLNELIPGVGFSLNDIRGALYACPYDLAARRTSPWCDVFTKHELRDLEYELDLLLDGISGHPSSGDPGPLLGTFYIKKLIERLTGATGDVEPLYLEFAHDLTILLVLSTMGLNKDPLPLSIADPSPHRKFRSSYQTPFAANMIWEKFTCQRSFEGPQVRLVLNGGTFPLSICDKSAKDKKYGTCSLSEFVRANEYSLGVQYQDEAWNATCEFATNGARHEMSLDGFDKHKKMLRAFF